MLCPSSFDDLAELRTSAPPAPETHAISAKISPASLPIKPGVLPSNRWGNLLARRHSQEMVPGIRHLLRHKTTVSDRGWSYMPPASAAASLPYESSQLQSFFLETGTRTRHR